MATAHPLAAAIDRAITAWLQPDDSAPPLAPELIGLYIEGVQDVSPELLSPLTVAAAPSPECLAPKIAVFVPYAALKAGWANRIAYANAIDAMRVSSAMPGGDGTIVCAWVERALLAASTSCVCTAPRAPHRYQRSSRMYQLQGAFGVVAPVRLRVRVCLDLDPGLARRYGPYPACHESNPACDEALVSAPPMLSLEAQLFALCETVLK